MVRIFIWPKIFSENIDPFLNIPLYFRIILWQTSAFLAKRLEYWMRNFLQAQWIYSVIIQRWNKIYCLYLVNKTISYFLVFVNKWALFRKCNNKNRGDIANCSEAYLQEIFNTPVQTSILIMLNTGWVRLLN